MGIKFAPYGALMINRVNRSLIVFHLYCYSKQNLSMLLMADVTNLAHIIYEWLTIMGYGENELSTINML